MADSFGDRMKKYERLCENVLIPRLPVIIRLDGNSFSKLTKSLKLQKPFDVRFEDAMECAAVAVLKYCSGAQLAYVQSDEITILLRNDQTIQTDPFLANRTQKLASLCASKASVEFNLTMRNSWRIETEAIFDCRVFTVPPHEVNNVFLWRQQDAFKNSISSYAYWGLVKKYGRKTAQTMLHGLNGNQKQEVIFQELGVNFNDLPTDMKRGRTIIRRLREERLINIVDQETLQKLINRGEDVNKIVARTEWVIDREIPLFNQDPNYIGKFM